MGRVDLIEEDLAVEFPQESLDQLEDTLIELLSLCAILLLLVNRHGGCTPVATCASRSSCVLGFDVADSGMLVDGAHRYRLVAVRAEDFLVLQVDRHHSFLMTLLPDSPLRADVLLTADVLSEAFVDSSNPGRHALHLLWDSVLESLCFFLYEEALSFGPQSAIFVERVRLNSRTIAREVFVDAKFGFAATSNLISR